MKKNILIITLLTVSNSLFALTRTQLIQQEMHKGNINTPLYLDHGLAEKETTKFDYLRGQLCSNIEKQKFSPQEKNEYRNYVKNIIESAHDSYALFDSPNLSYIWYSLGLVTKPVRYLCYRVALKALENEMAELE